MTNCNSQVANQLDTFNGRFAEGDWGRLDLSLNKAPTTADILWLAARADGVACHLKRWEVNGRQLSLTFQKGPLVLGLIPLVLGALGIGVLGWKLFTVPSEAFLDTAKMVVIPLGIVAIGGAMLYFGRKNKAMLYGGLAIAAAGVAAGIFLGMRQLSPAAKNRLTTEGIPILTVTGK